MDVASIDPAAIQDASSGGQGTLAFASTGTYTIGTTPNPTTITLAKLNSNGMVQVVDGQNVVLNGRCVSNATDSGGDGLSYVILGILSFSAATITINPPSGQLALLNNGGHASAPSSITDNPITCMGAAGASNSAILTVTINGSVQNLGGYGLGFLNVGYCQSTITGSVINGDSNNPGASGASGAGAYLFQGSGPGTASYLTINGNATNYANSGIPVGVDAGTGLLDIYGDWKNYDPSLIPSGVPNAPTHGPGTLTGVQESLIVVRGNVDGPANCASYADHDSGGCVVVLGSLFKAVYITGGTLITYANAFVYADSFFNDNGYWISLGEPDPAYLAALEAGANGGHWRYTVCMPSIPSTLANANTVDVRRADPYSDTSLVTQAGSAALSIAIGGAQAMQLAYVYDRFYNVVTRNYVASTLTVKHADNSTTTLKVTGSNTNTVIVGP
jgi:hypothetical protein